MDGKRHPTDKAQILLVGIIAAAVADYLILRHDIVSFLAAALGRNMTFWPDRRKKMRCRVEKTPHSCYDKESENAV